MEFDKFRFMQFTREVYVGHGVINKVPDVVNKNLMKGNVAIITGHNTYKIAGKEIADLLEDASIENSIFICESADEENLNRVNAEIKEYGAGIVIGAGGGSKIDLAKKTAYNLNIPLISIPTTPSHDGIASPRASIKRGKWSVSEEAVMPISIIADTYIMSKVPYRYLKAGAADVISNESALLDWKLANRIKGEEFSSSAAAIAEYASKELVERAHLIMPEVEESVWLVTKQILASGTSMAIAASSRPASGSEHLIAHALEMLAPGTAIHGEQVALGCIVSLFLHGKDWKAMENVFRKIGISTRASDYGINDHIMIEALRTAHRIRPERFTILGEVDLSFHAAESALKITNIIE
ncbi:MAG: NAD(P)-dependent glycerol-1-phosphate dehydrogenase [Candidatus Thermoplasmatota archaeon]|jgi:glycerol-1-phosphate dehydrogenase [NAD(P)+]|nr:NAD(P)-dependent glycerol-1-phosphate dehydrogenase [Candidatus Thermoplasmatota archaeon]MCL5988318.1 NAD(P)-dependent glycerol-1-phosphate dehydrogenase [Candidatus Thermoplasmatota archaeon]